MQDSPAGQVIFKCLARVLAPKVAVQDYLLCFPACCRMRHSFCRIRSVVFRRFSIPAPSQAVLFRSLSEKRGRRKIISTPTGNEFVTFEIREIAPIAVAKKYAGIGSYGSNQKYENAV